MGYAEQAQEQFQRDEERWAMAEEQARLDWSDAFWNDSWGIIADYVSGAWEANKYDALSAVIGVGSAMDNIRERCRADYIARRTEELYQRGEV